MNDTNVLAPMFHKGDEVELIAGTYQGTLGVFVDFRSDLNWADIAERNGEVRPHPLKWLGHARRTEARV